MQEIRLFDYPHRHRGLRGQECQRSLRGEKVAARCFRLVPVPLFPQRCGEADAAFATGSVAGGRRGCIRWDAREASHSYFAGIVPHAAKMHAAACQYNFSPATRRDGYLLREQQAKLLILRLLEELDADTFAAKNMELCDRIAGLSLQLDATDRNRKEQAGLANALSYSRSV